MKKKSTNKIKVVFWLFAGVLICAVLVTLVIQYEGEEPQISLDLPMRSIGVAGKLTGTVSDRKSGLRSLWIALSQKGKDHVLLDQAFPVKLFSKKDRVFKTPVDLAIEPQRFGLADGPVTLKIRVSDGSFRNWFKGNVAYIEKELSIDTNPPEIEVLTRNHNMVNGGTALAIYRVSETGGRTGVHVGDDFFPGYSGYYKDPNIMIAFFALKHDQGSGTSMYIEAMDGAGNSARAGFMYYIGHKQYKNDRLNISDGFLNAKMPGFTIDGVPDNSDNLAKFLTINGDIRKENGQRILSAGSNSEKTMMWKGAFIRLPGSATRANYADHRSYFHNGKLIDKQYHMGFDLASVKQAPIPAANSGKVAMVEHIGIYGKTVVLDHGYGLFSTYSHLSRVNVKVGDRVAKGDTIGNSGITGLTGGDHLHYGMFVDHVFVDPLQWWDSSWIENNITSKLNEIQASQ